MKFAIVGCGSRHQMYRNSLVHDYAEKHELVALCDNNPHRLGLSAEAALRDGSNGVATYSADQFDTLIKEQKPDAIVIATPDFLHADYIVRAFEAGMDVICEKPMTINLESLRHITEAQRRTGKKIKVTFNYRYSPARTQIKDILDKGTIGEITAVDFRWHLDRVHGADYFRRWHRKKENSGGLLVHKSTHHFDLLNWWLSSTPEVLWATGRRAFYHPQMAADLGLSAHGVRCTGCPVSDDCDFYLDIDAIDNLRALYRDGEDDDGYFRDRCVFNDDVELEDTIQATIRYKSGATANYTLTAYSPWEGLEIKFQGTKGELTHRHVEKHGIFGDDGNAEMKDMLMTELHLAGGAPERLVVPTASGHHGGADPVMLGYIFDAENMEPDRYNRASDHVAGGWSIMTGIAANASISSGDVVNIPELLAAHEIQLDR